MTGLGQLAPAGASALAGRNSQSPGVAVFLRVTVMGTARCADMSIGSDVPLGALLPDIVAAVEPTPGSSPLDWVLVGDTGEILPLAATPQDLRLGQGAMVRLIPATAVPPPAIVTNLTAAIADDWSQRTGMMGPSIRAALGCAALVVFDVLIVIHVGKAGRLPTGQSLVFAAGVIVLATMALLGFIPLFALHLARLTKADDATEADPLRRAWVKRALDRAHDVESGAVLLCGFVIAACCVMLAGEPGWWVFTLVGLVCLITALRSLVFPEAVARATLVATALSGVVALVFTRIEQMDQLLLIGCVAVFVITVACLWRPAPHTVARLRRIAQFAEAAAVLATVPVLLGAIGIYSRLLGSTGS